MKERDMEKNFKSEKGGDESEPMETTYVGFPGSEKLHTDAEVEDQMKLERLEGSVATIEEKITDMLRRTEAIKIRERQTETAKKKEGAEEADEETIREIAEFLELFEEEMYLVDYETIDDQRIPKDCNLYLAIGQNEIENLKEEIKPIADNTEEKEGIGLEAEIGPVKVFFIYAK